MYKSQSISDEFLARYRKPHGRALVGSDVLSVLSKIAERRLKLPPAPGDIQRKKLELLASGKIQAGVGVDLEKSRLRQMRYARIAVEKRELHVREYRYTGRETSNAMCLVGTTDNVYMEEINERNEITGLWDMGAYQIVVPVPDILSKRIDRIAFIPDRLPETEERHPHHRKGHTCWFGFADSVIGAMNYIEIAELFRVLRIFAGRWSTAHELTTEWQDLFARQLAGFRWENGGYQFYEVNDGD